MYADSALFDMPLDAGCAAPGERHIPHWLANIVFVLLWPLARGLFRLKVEGREAFEELAETSGVFLAANHCSLVDPVFVYCALRPRYWVRFMAKQELFGDGHKLGGHILARMGAFPIKRDHADKTNIKRAITMLKRHEHVLVFPEGTRRGKTTRELALHNGAAFIAHMASAPVIPVGIVNTQHLVRHGLPRLPRISIRFGRPFTVHDFDAFPKSARLDVCTWFMMREVHALAEGISPEDVPMDELYPGSTNYAAELRGFVPASRLTGEMRPARPQA